MRLLQLKGDSGFQLVNRIGKDIPPYAILSHTWGSDDDEVTFKDILDGTGTAKAGYRKIEFCGKQAARDNLKYFWIDTCCIDKSSSSELSEAINSMFRWYWNAAECYVYLDDVSSADSSANNSLAFQKSRWFTRGWTLQELIAPKRVKFFSREGELLGDKSSRVQEITEITHIPSEALLQEGALSGFSVEQRMVWAEERNTTREEDMAYCLLGVFDIQMPLIYGEGREKAIKRLHKAIRDSLEEGSGTPLENAQKWLEGATIDKDVQEYLRLRFSDKKGWDNREEEVTLQPDCFKFILQTPTALSETNEHFRLLMGDSNKEGPPDLIAVKRTSVRERSAIVHVLSGASNYQEYNLLIATPHREGMTAQLEFALTDWNGDGTLDLITIKKNYTGTNSTEVHILSGASNFQQYMLQTGTILAETDETFAFAMGGRDGSTKPNLFAIKKSKTSSHTTEVHVLSGATNFQNFVVRTDTGLHETDDTYDFIVTDWNGDGHSDLVAIKKSNTSGKCTEVHVLSGVSMYKNFILRAETPLYRSKGMFEFAVADWTGNGKPDLVAVAKRDTGSNTTEVNVMSLQG